ncbi:NUDIX hydrolase [Hyalangium sp.]|uniref:NUDIX hydrolase n=1 Tax=Hyalangium sp. TaxID=2028555 RepID=UPI002D299131|nr:NUDIX hydrolase [Hyalangium sp.]HYI01064.1 NUDIX hydrolase [Hyalangium sp.]
MTTATTATAAPPAWTEQQAAQILEKTQTIRLTPDLSTLTPGERTALSKLLEVGQLFQELYEDSRHRQALALRKRLEGQKTPLAEQQRTLYGLFQGPIANTLENERVPFLAADAVVPGKNVYPWGITKEQVQQVLERRPELRASLLDPRTVVRRADAASLKKDLDALKRHPVLEGLHPGLSARLRALAAKPDPAMLYAVPYSVAYAPQMVKAHGLLWEAAAAVEGDDPEFAGYLRNRARDLLSNDYESGDASWVRGRFQRLNAQIGAYEVYDDELFGAKAFYSLSVLLRDDAATARLEKALQGLQAFEDSLPYEPHKTVSSDIPVGVYQVIADFAQARGANTATILPNDPLHARRYGRTILLRSNIMRHPDLFANGSTAWQAVVAAPFRDHLGPSGSFNRTLWHEVGHYLGVDRDVKGRSVSSDALEENSSALEEMKADLVSLYLAKALRERGFYDDTTLRELYASGIFRVLQIVRPRRDQPYQTMQLMQMNYFLESGLLEVRPDGLHIHYDKYPGVVSRLLREVLAIQRAGDKAASDRFIEKYTRWDDAVHGALAAKMRAQQKYRYTLVKYAALGE